MRVFTIGFTKKTAEKFFALLKSAGVTRVVDIRLNNTSQLAGFAKQEDLKYFLKEICGIEYIHMPELAPTKQIMDNYKKGNMNWTEYEKNFRKLMQSRAIQKKFKGLIFDGDCFLCSEEDPARCHRRLVAEYLQERWADIFITHLV